MKSKEFENTLPFPFTIAPNRYLVRGQGSQELECHQISAGPQRHGFQVRGIARLVVDTLEHVHVEVGGVGIIRRMCEHVFLRGQEALGNLSCRPALCMVVAQQGAGRALGSSADKERLVHDRDSASSYLCRWSRHPWPC
jgi:hypothetical protein